MNKSLTSCIDAPLQAKKFAKPEVKAMADDFESRIAKHHEERREHDLAVQNAQAHQNRSSETTLRTTGEFIYGADFRPFNPHRPWWNLKICLFEKIKLRTFE